MNNRDPKAEKLYHNYIEDLQGEAHDKAQRQEQFMADARQDVQHAMVKTYSGEIHELLETLYQDLEDNYGAGELHTETKQTLQRIFYLLEDIKADIDGVLESEYEGESQS